MISLRFNRSFYKKILFYAVSSGIFIFLITKLLSSGLVKLQNLSADVFNVLLIKGYSLIFMLIFFIQIVNGLVISLSTCYQFKGTGSPVDLSGKQDLPVFLKTF